MARQDTATHQAQLRQVQRILWIDWDPIGVNDSPEAFGEYDLYAATVLGRILNGASAADIDFHLARIETDSMGLGASPSSTRFVAVSKLLAIGSGAVPTNHEGPDVLAMVALLPTGAGGRAGPAHNGYRPHHRLLGDYQTSGVHHYPGRSTLNPGETAETTISFLEPLAYLRSITKGDVIEISEGSRVVGHATILAVFNPVLQRAG